MKQQTPQLIILFEHKKEKITKIKCGGFAAENKESVQTKIRIAGKSKALPKKKKAGLVGLRHKVDYGLIVFLIITAPFIIHFAGNYVDWFVATEVARHLGMNLKPEQINLLIDKMFDVLLAALVNRLTS